MTEFLRNWIINIITIIIFIVIVEALVPSDKFKKYVKLVTGLVLIIIIMNPIISLINDKYSLGQIAINTFGNLEKNQIEIDSNLSKIQNTQVISIYKQRLGQDIKEKISEITGINNAHVNINIEADGNNKKFGQILNLEIVLYTSNKIMENNQTDIAVNNINIMSEDQLCKKLIQELSTTYGISQDKINIKIQK